MKARAAAPDVLVDLQDLDELRSIRDLGNGSVEIGAMTTYSDIVSDEAAGARSILGEVAAAIADVQVRNRGTIGGNICSNDPTNHFPPVLAALEAQMTIRGFESERTVSVDEFFEGVFMTAVAPGEMLTKVTVRAREPGQGDGYASVTLG